MLVAPADNLRPQQRSQEPMESFANVSTKTRISTSRILFLSKMRRQMKSFASRGTFLREVNMAKDHNDENNDAQSGEIDRRDFVALSVAGIVVTAGWASAAALEVAESNVDIKTPDGNCDAAFIYPKSGSHAGVLIWTDAFGLRPAFREMAKRLAAEGYSVLVPNPFYRVAKAPVFADVASFDFQNPTDRAKLGPLMGSINAAGAAEKDAAAYIAFLDSQKQVDKAKKIGAQGYCMGGPLIVRTAAALPNRIGAAASFHGGGLVTANPDSPHLLAPKIKARMYFGVAANDDKQQPDAKDKLKEAFAAAKVPAEIEVYPQSQHGWCVSDMPAQNGSPIYNKGDADRAWGKLLALYKAGLS
jgi:carboxymethylenebutenolidase